MIDRKTLALSMQAVQEVSSQLAAIANGSGINDKGIATIKLASAVPGKNRFDKSRAVLGYFVSNTTGDVAPNASYYVTDYTEIPGDAYVTFYRSYALAYYDENKVYISGVATGSPATVPRTLKTPANARYVRTNMLIAQLNSYQIVLGTEIVGYEAYKTLIGVAGVEQYQEDLYLALSPVVPAVVGRECNIYFENLYTGNYADYRVNVVCVKGQQQRERWTYVPVVGDVGDVPITIELYKYANLVANVSSVIRVSAADAGSGLNKKVLVIGDSTTANGIAVGEVLAIANSDVIDVSMIGTQGTSPASHEGYSGTTVTWHQSDASSPFVFSGEFNFGQYLAAHSYVAPDIVFLNLGINDIFGATTDSAVMTTVADICTKYDAMIESIKATNAAVKIGVCVPIPAGNEDAFAVYESGQTSWRYNRNNRIAAKMLNLHYRSSAAQNVHLIPINAALDTVNNSDFAVDVQVNSRNPLTVARQKNGVHPGTYGYYQIADCYFAAIKYLA